MTFKSELKNTFSKLTSFAKYAVLTTSIMQNNCTAKNPDYIKPTNFVEPYTGEIINDETGAYQKSRGIVKFKNTTTSEEAEEYGRRYDLKLAGWIESINCFIYDTGENRDSKLMQISADSNVESVSRNYYYVAVGGWDNEREEFANKPKKDWIWWNDNIKLSEGLTLLNNSTIPLKPITIGIIDIFGFKTYNKQIPYVDKEFWRNVPDNDDLLTSSDEHADMTAQFAAAINDGQKTNGVASAGINIFKILPIKSQASDPAKAFLGYGINALGGDEFNLAASLTYAAEISEKVNLGVVNMSITYPQFAKYKVSPLSLLLTPYFAVKAAIELLNKKNIIVVAGAGNDNKNACDNVPSSLPKVIAVGGTKLDSKTEKRYYYNEYAGSNYSTDEKCITVTAPAQDLLVYNDETPISINGTSFATPMVSGLVAIIKSIKPDATYEEVISILRNNSDEITLTDDPIPQMKGQIWKRINVERTVSWLIYREYIGCRYILETEESNDVFSFDGRRLIYEPTKQYYNEPRVYIYDFEERKKVPIISPTSDEVIQAKSEGDILIFQTYSKTNGEHTCYSTSFSSPINQIKLQNCPLSFILNNGKVAADTNQNTIIANATNGSIIRTIDKRGLIAYFEPYTVIDNELYELTNKTVLPSDISYNLSVDGNGIVYETSTSPYELKYYSFQTKTASKLTSTSYRNQGYFLPSIFNGVIAYSESGNEIVLYDIKTATTRRIQASKQYLGGINNRGDSMLLDYTIPRGMFHRPVFCKL